MTTPLTPDCDPALEDCSIDTTQVAPGPSQGLIEFNGGWHTYLNLALATSISTVGRAQLLAGIVTLASVETTSLSRLSGYLNSVFGGAAVLYDFLRETLDGALAEKLQTLVAYA